MQNSSPDNAEAEGVSLSKESGDAKEQSSSQSGDGAAAGEAQDQESADRQKMRTRLIWVRDFMLGLLLGVFFMAVTILAIWYFQGELNFGSDSAIKSETYSFTDSKGKTYKRELPVLDDTVRLIQKKYIRAMTAQELLNGAAENVNYTLDCFGLADSCAIKSISDEEAKKKTDDELIQSFKNELIPVLAAVEKMPEDTRTLHRSQLKKASKKKLAELEAKEAEKNGKDNTVESSALQQAKADQHKSEEAEKEKEGKDDPDGDIVKDSDKKPIVLDSELLFYSALNGLAYATDDPFTTAMLPKEYKIFKQSIGNDEYGGVGIYLEADLKNNRQVTVIEPIDGTPADKAGICPGDKIMAIDGKKTSELEIDTASAMIRGKVGTKVKLTLKRGEKTFDVELTRTNIRVPSVTSKMLENGIAYLRVRFFGEDTGKEFASGLKEMTGKNPKALIIDLRNNGGGYIIAAIDLVSQFLPKGKTVTTVVNPRLHAEEAYLVETDEYNKLPIVLLVNRFSASASEITAGAFQDLHRALLVGETTYGKGSVQTLNTLNDGGAFKLTIAHYLTPHNKDIHLKGITPDIVKEAEPTNKFGGPKDEQLNLALKEAKKLIDAGTKDFIEIKDSASKANPALHKDRSKKDKK